MPLYLFIDNHQSGPFEDSVVQNWLRNGHVSPHDLAIRPGMNEWQPLGKLLPAENAPPPQQPPPPQSQQQTIQMSFGTTPPVSNQPPQTSAGMTQQPAFSQPAAASYSPALGEIFGFTNEELNLNQQGKMSERQKSKLKFNGGLGCLGVLLIGGLLACLLSVFAFVNTGNFSVFPLLIGLFFVGLSVSIGAWSIKKTSEYKVENYEGYIEKVVESRRAYSGAGGCLGVLLVSLIYAVTGWDKAYFFKVGNVKLKASKKSFESLDDSNFYRVYYSAHPKRLLSLEISPRNKTEKAPFKLTLFE